MVVVAVSGGGSEAISELLAVPGASRTLLEAVVPYSEAALIDWLGGRPDQFCSASTARAMAMAAFRRGCKLHPDESLPAGIACSARLATDRPKRGPHRAHLAMQTAASTTTWSIELAKGRRTRAEEEQLVSRLLLNVAAEACGVDGRLDLGLLEGERVECARTVAPPSWQDLLLGRVQIAFQGSHAGPAEVVFPGAFNPLHVGHLGMAAIAVEMLRKPVTMELAILNVDKPPLDYSEIEGRLRQFDAGQGVCLTRAATFEEKASLFPGATFLVGVDTLRRIADPRYYRDAAACAAALERIVGRGCRFLVFARRMGADLIRMSHLDLPDTLRSLCREVHPDVFREDISSTELRRRQNF